MASAWTVFNKAKHNIGLGNIDLSAGTMKAVLYGSSASANLSANATISSLASVGTYTSTAGNGDEVATLGTLAWTGVTSAGGNTRKWDVADFTFTASTQTISSIRYCVVYQSNGASAGTGRLVCYCLLSTGLFALATNSTLTVQINAAGVFTLL
jgi:hypothetical protein